MSESVPRWPCRVTQRCVSEQTFGLFCSGQPVLACISLWLLRRDSWSTISGQDPHQGNWKLTRSISSPPISSFRLNSLDPALRHIHFVFFVLSAMKFSCTWYAEVRCHREALPHLVLSWSVFKHRGSIMVTVFWNLRGVILFDVLPPKTTMKGLYFAGLINSLTKIH